jgi:hypothetical protein
MGLLEPASNFYREVSGPFLIPLVRGYERSRRVVKEWKIEKLDVVLPCRERLHPPCPGTFDGVYYRRRQQS